MRGLILLSAPGPATSRRAARGSRRGADPPLTGGCSRSTRGSTGSTCRSHCVCWSGSRGPVAPPDRPAMSCGAIVAVCWLARCVPTGLVRETLEERELGLGDYSNGRYAWQLAAVHALPEPSQVRGQMGLWVVEDRVVGENRKQVELTHLELEPWKPHDSGCTEEGRTQCPR